VDDREKILAFLSEHGDSTPRQIADATGIFIVTVGMTLDELEAAGEVCQVGRHYRKFSSEGA
jgi:DNA-binding MarR family transcriptional regulator